MRKKDDGIKFQWGDKYIKSSEIIEGVGRKYIRFDGPDDAVTMFTPPMLMFRIVVSEIKLNLGFSYEDPKCNVNEKKMIIKFTTEDKAMAAYNEFTTCEFWSHRDVDFSVDGRILAVKPNGVHISKQI